MSEAYEALLSGAYWSGIEVTNRPVFVTYSFPSIAPVYLAGIDDPALTPAALATFQAFNASEQAMARAALQEWGDACGITFLEVAQGQGDINFQKIDFTGTGYDGAGGIGYHPWGDWHFASHPYFSGDLDGSGDVFMNSDLPMTQALLLHEIGHALGLKHPTEAWTQWGVSPPVEHEVWAVDDPLLTIMSQVPGGTGHLTAIDIQAIQSIYGTGAQDGTQVALWSWNAAAETLVQTGFSGADAIRGSSVKDVIRGKGGGDKLFGLSGADTLYGDSGGDTLDGGAGADRMAGGKGNDVYFVDAGGDRVIEESGGGTDTVYATRSETLASQVETLVLLGDATLTGTGNARPNSLFAGAGRSALNGMAGDDYLVGGARADTLTGGSGSDLVYGGGAVDRFVFAALSEFAPASAPDAIGDFSHAEGDRIDFRPIDPDGATGGDQAFSFVGTAAFTTDARFQVRYELAFGNAWVQIDIDHDRQADATILLYGVSSLVAGDFLL